VEVEHGAKKWLPCTTTGSVTARRLSGDFMLRSSDEYNWSTTVKIFEACAVPCRLWSKRCRLSNGPTYSSRGPRGPGGLRETTTTI
jgi:hypothetical protein